MKVAIVGGSYNHDGGRPSGLIRKMEEYIRYFTEKKDIILYNGGTVEDLRDIYEGNILNDCEVIFWLANVPNTEPKLRDIKLKYPKKLLVTSKRNIEEKYSFSELVNRALQLKANLVIEFSKKQSDITYKGRVFDPLGTVWCDKTEDFYTLIKKTMNRLYFLRYITRKPTIQRNSISIIPEINNDFLTIVRNSAETFHDLVKPAKEVTRFLGNASFRCQKGFPSFRADKGIYVSKRNVDKTGIQAENFVYVTRGENGEVLYDGESKPSVDTPIQLALYEKYSNINYMLHAHVYVEGASFTSTAVPCGALEEIEEIRKLLPDTEIKNAAVNLVGHGCLIMADSLVSLEKLSSRFISRNLPEVVTLIGKEIKQ